MESMCAADLRWGIVLKGHTVDIDVWQRFFVKPFYPYVENTSLGVALWSLGIQEARNSLEAWELCKTEIQLMNSIVLNSYGGEWVQADGVIEIDRNGDLNKHVILEPKPVKIRISVGTPTISIDGEDSKVNGQIQVLTLQQDWWSMAKHDDILTDLLVHGSKNGDWIEMYKVIEKVEQIFGGEYALKKAVATETAISAESIAQLKRTANFYHRHTSGKYLPPANPTSLKEAKQVIAKLIQFTFATRMRDSESK
jgi:hypothetical protein